MAKVKDILLRFTSEVKGGEKVEDHLANVNREEAKAKGLFDQTNQSIQAQTGSLKQLRDELDKLKERRDSIAVNTEEFENLRRKIFDTETQLKKAEGRIDEFGKRTQNTTVESINAFIKLGAAVTAAYGIAKLVTFGKTQEQIAKSQQKAQNAIAAAMGLVAIAEGVVAAKRVITTIATNAATIATRALNLALSLNPFAAVALAIGAALTALGLYKATASDAADEQERLNEAVTTWRVINVAAEKAEQNQIKATNERIKQLEREIKLLDAQGDKEKESTELRLELAKERLAVAQDELNKKQPILEAEIKKMEELQIVESLASEADKKRLGEKRKELDELKDTVNDALAEGVTAAAKLAKINEDIASGATPIAVLRKQLETLRSQLNDTTKSHEEYLAVLLKIEKKEDDIAIATGERTKGEKEGMIAFTAHTQSKLEGFKKAGKAMSEDFDKYFENEEKKAKKNEENRKKSDADALKEEERIAKQIELAKQLGDQYGVLLGDFISTTGEQQKEAGKALILSTIDILANVVSAALAKIVAESFATPDSIATFGATGAARVAVLTGLVTAGIKTASTITKSIISGFAEGSEYIEGGKPGRDSVPAMLMPGERVVTKDMNIKYYEALSAIHNDKFDHYLKDEYLPSHLPELMPSLAGNVAQSMQLQASLDDYNIIRAIKKSRAVKIENVQEIAQAVRQQDREAAFLKRHRWDA